MLNITSEAQQKIAELVVKSENPVRGLRIGAEAKSSSKVDYKLAFISEDQVSDDDERISFEGFDVFITSCIKLQFSSVTFSSPCWAEVLSGFILRTVLNSLNAFASGGLMRCP